MRTFLLLTSLFFSASAFAESDTLICGLVLGKASVDKAIEIKREDMGNGSYTEYTIAELKLKGMKMEVTQEFERISIEVKNSAGVTKLRIEGENKVGVDINPDSKNTLNASCVIVRNN